MGGGNEACSGRAQPNSANGMGLRVTVSKGNCVSWAHGWLSHVNLERVKGIEPSSQAWEARILPLNHTRFR